MDKSDFADGSDDFDFQVVDNLEEVQKKVSPIGSDRSQAWCMG